MEDRWFGNAFQIFKATEENDLEAAMVVLRGGTYIEKDEEEVRDAEFASTGISGYWNLAINKYKLSKYRKNM